jgi:predicted membrane-bound spermidine synthase
MERTESIHSKYFFLLAAVFISGGVVMAVELVSAKMISSYYGNSLYVWSAVLALTLGGLAAGYFAGGVLSVSPKRKRSLFLSFLTVSILLLLLPFLSETLIAWTLGMKLKWGIVISSLLFVFPPLFCFGLISPLAIGVAGIEINDPGKLAGLVYSISTAGGILMTFITGYILIPRCGLNATSYILSGCMMLALASVFFGLKDKS